MHISLEAIGVIVAIIVAFGALYFPARAKQKEQETKNLAIERWRTQKEERGKQQKSKIRNLKRKLERLEDKLEVAKKDGQDDNNLILKGLSDIRKESTSQHKDMRELLSSRTKELHEEIKNLRDELHETNKDLTFLKGRLSVEDEKTE